MILLLIIFIAILVLRIFDYRIQTYVLCGLLMLFYLFLNQQYIFFCISKYGLKICAIFVFLVLMTLISVIESKTRISFFYQIMLFFLFYIFFSTFYIKNGENSYHWLFLSLYKASIFLSLAGIYEGLIRENLFRDLIYSNYFAYAEHTDLYRVSLMFIHPIVYAHFVMLMLIYGFYFDKSKYKIINCTILLVNIYLTKARSIWISIAVVAVIYLIKKNILCRNKIKKRTLICLFAMPVVLLLGYYYFLDEFIVQKIWGRFIEAFSSNSYFLRISAINNLLEYFLHDNSFLRILFGNGNGAATVMMENVVSVRGIGQYSMTTTDNFYLSFLYNFGIFTIFILFLFLIGVFKRTLTTNHRLLEYIGLSLISSIIAIVFYDVFSWEIIIFLIMSQVALYNMITLNNISDKEINK